MRNLKEHYLTIQNNLCQITNTIIQQVDNQTNYKKSYSIMPSHYTISL